MNQAYTSFSQEDNINKYLPLVKQIVDQIVIKNTHEMDKDDLTSIGVIGLMDAMSKFDSRKNIPFQFYAKWRIKGAILDELRKNGKVSRDKIKRLNQVYEMTATLQQKLLMEPTDKEICENMGISLKELHGVLETAHYLSHISLEKSFFSADEEEFNLIDIIEDKNQKSPEMIFLEDEREKSLVKAIEKLSEREQLILNLYYYEELTLKEIGEILEVSLSRVSQIHGKILIRLRDILKNLEKRGEIFK